jgi:hypothetical protein
MKRHPGRGSATTTPKKTVRAELLVEVDRIRAMTPPRRSGMAYPTAEQLVRKARTKR